MAHRIRKEECISCGACEGACPVACISEVAEGKRLIAEEDCIDCGACAGVCPVECIDQV